MPKTISLPARGMIPLGGIQKTQASDEARRQVSAGGECSTLLTGSQDCRATGPQGYGATGPQGHRATGLRGHRTAGLPEPPGGHVLWVHVPGIGCLQDTRQRSHCNPREHCKAHSAEVTIGLRVVRLQQFSRALEAVDVGDAHGQLDMHVGKEVADRLLGEHGVEPRVHPASVVALDCRSRRHGQEVGRPAFLLEQRRPVALGHVEDFLCARKVKRMSTWAAEAPVGHATRTRHLPSSAPP
eukprot:scaffold1147_cov250-Pinguiococcus_pyrenoidosus.AAC.3